METEQSVESIEEIHQNKENSMEESEVAEGPELIQTQELEHVLHETRVSDNVPDEESTEQEVPVEEEKSEEKEVVETDAVEVSASTEEDVLLEPTAISNPLLKSVLAFAPPTPRDASPLQIAIEEIHSSKVAEETTSPLERKEEEVELPVEVCEFPVISSDEEGSDEPANKHETEIMKNDVPEAPTEQEPETTINDVQQIEPDEPEQDSAQEEVPETDIQSLEESAVLEGNGDAEFEIISTDEAPMELAEEYPQFQDESDDLEASTITGLEASQRYFAVETAEMDGTEPISDVEIPVEEPLIDPRTEELVASIEEPEMYDTEAFETASVVTVQSIHSVIAIEHTQRVAVEPEDIEVEADVTVHTEETSAERPGSIAEEPPNDDAPVELPPEDGGLVEEAIKAVEVADSSHEESPIEQEPKSIAEESPIDESPVEESPQDNQLTEDNASSEALDPTPDKAPQELSDAHDLVQEPSVDCEVMKEITETVPLENPTTEVIEGEEEPVVDSEPPTVEEERQQVEQLSISETAEETEAATETVEEQLVKAAELEAEPQDESTQDDEPQVIPEPPVVDETPETTMIENDITPAFSEAESIEESIVTPQYTSQDGQVPLSKEIEEGTLSQDILVNTMMVTDGPVTIFETPQVVEDKENFPLIEITEVDSPVAEEQDGFIADEEGPADEVTEVEAQHPDIHDLQPAEELIYDDGISELNIPAPVVAVPISEKEPNPEVVEDPAAVDEELAIEPTVEPAAEMENENVHELIEEAPVTEDVAEEVQVEEIPATIEEVPTMEDDEPELETEQLATEEEITEDSPMEPTPMVEFSDLLDDGEVSAEESAVPPAVVTVEGDIEDQENPADHEEVTEPSTPPMPQEEPIEDEDDLLRSPDEHLVTDDVEDSIDPPAEEEVAVDDAETPIVVEEETTCHPVLDDLSSESPAEEPFEETTLAEEVTEAAELVTMNDTPVEDYIPEVSEGAAQEAQHEEEALDIPAVDESIVIEYATEDVPVEDPVDEDPASTSAHKPEEIADILAETEAELTADDLVTVHETTIADDIDELTPEDLQDDEPLDTIAAPEETSEEIVEVDDPIANDDLLSAPVDIVSPEEIQADALNRDADEEALGEAALETSDEPQDIEPDEALVDDTAFDDESGIDAVGPTASQEDVAEGTPVEATLTEELWEELPEEGAFVEDPPTDGDPLDAEALIEPQEEEITEVSVEDASSEEPPQELPETSNAIEETTVLAETEGDAAVEDISAEFPEKTVTEEEAVVESVEEPEIETALSEANPEDPTADLQVADSSHQEPAQVEEPSALQEGLVEDIVDGTLRPDDLTNEQEANLDQPETEKSAEAMQVSDDIPEPIDDMPTEAPIEAVQDQRAVEPVAEETVPTIDKPEARAETDQQVEEREVIVEVVHAQDAGKLVEEPVDSENVEGAPVEPSVLKNVDMEESQHDQDVGEESPAPVVEEETVHASVTEEENLDDIPDYLPLPPEVDTSLNVFDDLDESPPTPAEEPVNDSPQQTAVPEDMAMEDDVDPQLDDLNDRDIYEAPEDAEVDSEIHDDNLDPEMAGSLAEPPLDDEEFEPSLIDVQHEETADFNVSDPFASADDDFEGEEQGSAPEESEVEMAVDDMGFPLDLSQNNHFVPSDAGEVEPSSAPADENPFDEEYIQSQEGEREMAVDDMGIPLDLLQNTALDDQAEATEVFHEDDSAQESDTSLVGGDTPQTPMSPLFVHQHSESYTELLHDADDETVERSIQDDFTLQRPVSADFEAGDGVEEVAEEEPAVDDVDAEAEFYVEETPLEELEAPQEGLPSETEPPKYTEEAIELPSEQIVETLAPDEQAQDAAPTHQQPTSSADEADIYALLQNVELAPPDKTRGITEPVLKPADSLEPVNDEPWVQEVLDGQSDQPSDTIPVPDSAEEVALDNVNEPEPSDRQIVEETPLETEIVEETDVTVVDILDIVEDQEPELDLHEPEEQAPVYLDEPSERKMVEEQRISVDDDQPIPEDQQDLETAPVAEVAEEEAVVSDEPFEPTEQAALDPVEPLDLSPTEDDAFADPAWMTESGIADKGTEVDSVAPAIAAHLSTDKPKDADELSLNDVAPFYASPEGHSTENIISNEVAPEVGDTTVVDEDETTFHPPATNIYDEFLKTIPETALVPATPLILESRDNVVDTEEHDTFSQEPTYQTPISSPVSSPFLTPRSTRSTRGITGKSAYADSTLTLPLLPIDTSKPTMITLTPSDPFQQDYTPNLDQLPIYIPGPPVARPGTSYSWLGRMFDPIDPEIEAAQKEGWIQPLSAGDGEADGDGEGKRKGRRLRRKFFKGGLETVGEEPLERKGSGSGSEEKGGRRMWNLVRKIVKG